MYDRESPQAEEIPEDAHQAADPIKRLYTQIQQMPELAGQARVVDQVLLNHFQDLKGHARAVIHQFNEQKSDILKRFDNWLVPIAKEVLDELLQDAEQLKRNLNQKLEHLPQIEEKDWLEHAKRWNHLYTKWHDRKALADKVLALVADRTKQLIDKDIQVIQDYQTQSLAQVPEKSEAFEDLKERLTQATENPLKQLVALRQQTPQPASLLQASEWVARLQAQRETYFDQLLMKIDHVVKETVQIEEEEADFISFTEDEGEIVFMEREIHHIKSMVDNLKPNQASEMQFMLARLEELLDHIEQLETTSLPKTLQKRLSKIKETSSLLCKQLEST